MPLADRDIIITPNRGASSEPSIAFRGADTATSATVTLRVYNSSTVGTVSFEGAVGQLMTVVDSMAGTIFSVNDISGIPSIEVLDTGEVKLAQYNGFVNILGTLTSTSTNTGVLRVFGGVGINGNINVGGTAGFAGLTTVTNTTAASSTNTGALQVRGGAGIAGGLFVGGIVTATQITVNGFAVSTGTTATNITGGTAGAILYQSAASTTAFIGPGAAGSILQMGASTATFVTTGSIFVGNSANTNNILGGTAGALVYQSASGTTTFIGTGTTGSLLQMGATTATFVTTGSIFVGNAATSVNIAGGTAGALIYQSASDTTTFIGTGTTGSLLQMGATTATFVTTSNILVGYANTATQILTAAQTVNATYFLTIVDANNATAATEIVYTTSSFTINPSSGGINIAGVTTITNTTAASSTITGALQVRGGAGIGGNLYVESDGFFNGVRVGRGTGSLINNTILGNGALDSNTTGTDNVAVGYLSLNSNLTGAENVGIGYQTLYVTTNTYAATALGSSALQNVTSGQYNIGIGFNAGNSITTGSNNTIIGSVSGTAGMTDTVIVAAGTTERFRVDSTGSLIIAAAVSATSTATGALQVPGGVGIGGSLYVGGTITGQIMGYSLTTNARGSVSGAQTIDISLGNFVTATTTGATTWTFTSTVLSPNAVGFVFELTNGGSATQTWPTTVRWPGGTAPALTAAGVDVLTFISDDSGANWRGVASMLDSK